MLAKLQKPIAGILLILIWVTAAGAQSNTAQLPAEMEQRAKALFTELRCVVCQNQSIADSDADVAKDLRQIVREQIVVGKTNEEIRTFLTDRYGEFILLKPSLGWHTILLWGSPILVLLLGAFAALSAGRSRGDAQAQPLSTDEELELKKILGQSKD